MPDRNHRWALAALLAVAVLPYFIGLGDSAIWDANEAFYVETPREMIERGDYVSPTFNYEPRFNKPVLSYWIVAGFYQAFGISVGVQRLAVTLGAMGLLASAFLLAWLAASGTTGRGSPALDAALWAALGLAVSPRLLMLARRIFIDIYISLFLALTLVCFAAAERFPGRRRLFLALMYVSIGLGMLTKGPVAVVLPGLAFAGYLLAYRELRRVRSMMIPAGVLIVAAIVVPWYAALYARDGWTNIVSFFVGENLDRFTSGLGVRVERGPLFYLPVLFSDSFPWAAFLVAAFIAWWRERRHAHGQGDPSRRVRTLLWIWIAVFVGFFSLSAGKQDLYIFPIVPAVAALAGWVLARAIGGRERTPAAISAAVAGSALLIVGGGLLYLFEAVGASYALEGVGVIAAIGIGTGVLAVVYGWRERVGAAAFSLASGFVALSFVFVLRTLPSFEAYKPVPGFAATIARRAGPGDLVTTYEQAMPSLTFYLGRHVDALFNLDDLIRSLRSGKRVYTVMSNEDYQRVRGDLPGRVCVIDSRPTFDVRLRTVLERKPLPQLIVLTNVCETP
jgi:4-amino-4-deoxy-L-arabinose transferase-like glycosyltransferase